MGLSDEDLEKLVGLDPLVGVEAPAGAGKTHTACRLALDEAGRLESYQYVLFLSHTNAAREVFRRRMSAGQSYMDRVRVSTLDAFCLDIVSPYATVFGFDLPFIPPRPLPPTWFLEVRKKAAALVKFKADIARAIASRFPLVIADEHQDASVYHHEIVAALAEKGSRVRMFGDSLQAILTFDKSIPGWDNLMKDVPVVTLSGAWRWESNPELGAWIASCRECLRTNQSINLTRVPACVDVVRVDGAAIRWSRDIQVRAILEKLKDQASLVVLGRRNNDVREAARMSELNLVVNEGSDVGLAEELIAEVIAAGDDQSRLAGAIGDFMVGSGSLDSGTSKSIRDLKPNSDGAALVVRAVQVQATLAGAVQAIREAKASAKGIGWEIVHPVAVQTITRLPETISGDDVRDLIYDAQRAATEAPMAARCASTIHKAKGREFDHVVIPSLSRDTFGPSIGDRQLLYVALSRARKRLTLIVPKSNPSPLVSF